MTDLERVYQEACVDNTLHDWQECARRLSEINRTLPLRQQELARERLNDIARERGFFRYER
jgi:hypothetical protein